MDIPPFLSGFLDRNSPSCMFSAYQLRTYTTAHLSGVGWYLDCTLEYTHHSETELRKSLEGKGIVDLDLVDEFIGMDDEARRRAINKRDAVDRKKELKNLVAAQNKEKKEAEKAAKKAEKDAMKENEEKTRSKGKKKVEEQGQVVTSSTVDQAGQMLEEVKKKITLSQLTEDVISRVTQTLVLSDDEVPKTEDLILNVCIEDIAKDMESKESGVFDEVLKYLNKVYHFLVLVMS